MSTQIIQTKQMNNNSVNNFYKYINNMDVRVYKDENQNPWFVAQDVADILDYTNTRKAIRDHVDAEDKCVMGQIESQNEGYQNDTPQNQGERIVPPQNNTILINESGLYSLILRSKKKEAKQFKRWITSEVIPSLRKTGEYVVPKNIMKEKLDCIEIASRIFSTLRNGVIQDRDKLLLEDLARNAIIGSVSNMNEISKENEEWSISRRLQEVYGVSGKKINNMLISFGKKVLIKYREINDGKNPPKRDQYVDGTTRTINCYFSKDYDEFIDEMIEEHFKEFLHYEEVIDKNESQNQVEVDTKLTEEFLLKCIKPELVLLCESKGLKTKGTKSELISYLIQNQK
jgi:prophage antirepressor-like protein